MKLKKWFLHNANKYNCTDILETVNERIILIGTTSDMTHDCKIAFNIASKLINCTYIELRSNKAAHDLAAKHASKFWFSDYYFWEWIIKNDFAYLSPQQLLDRMRNNKNSLNIYQIILKSINYKLKCVIDKNIKNPRRFHVA